MIEVADVFRRFAADYLSAHGASMLPLHRRAIEDDVLGLSHRRRFGGQVWRCEQCDTEMFSWHSCGNRSCQKCRTAQTREVARKPPRGDAAGADSFHVTVTVPRRVARGAACSSTRDGLLPC